MSTISSTINHGITLGVPDYYSPLTLTNTGAVSNNGTGAAIYGYAGAIQNSGTISATGAGADGVNFGGEFSNDSVGNDGLVTATDSALYLAGNGSVTNTGTIISSGYDAIDIGGAGSVTNSAGTITAAHWGIRIRAAGSVSNGGTIQTSEAGIVALGGGNVTNTGLISAPNGIEISGGAGSVVNSGSIEANGSDGVTLGAGGTITNQANAVITSVGYTGVYITGGAGELVNAGTISGARGVAFAGTASYTLIDSGTIIGTAATAVSFGAGDDLLQFQPSASVFIQGTVDGAGGTNTLEFTSGASAGTLTGSGLVFTNFAQGTVDPGAAWALAGDITLDADTTLANAGALTDTGTLTNIGMLTGSGTLTVSGSLTNAGQISLNGTTGASDIQLKLNSGASLTNLSGATIGFVNADYQAVTPIIYGTGGPATVTNLGTIRHGEVGVSLNGGGRVVNGATDNSAALIATYDGILSSNTGSLTVANYATISSGHIGVGMGGAGVVINGATGATAALLTGEDGVVFYGRAGTVINFGTIVGTTHGSVIYTDGVFMGYGSGGTVIDAGTIMGSRYAVDFETSPTPGRYGNDGNNLLKLYPGADLVGKVTAAGTGNVLELAAGTAAGTINGIGTSFLGLGTITVDAGASWVITGNSSLSGGYTLTDAGTLTNTGSLLVDAPVRVTGTFINNSIVAASGGNDAIYVANSGVVTNTASGTITGGTVAVTAAGTATIDNFGTIEATSIFAAIAIASGTVINGDASNTAAAILGSTYGVEATGVATVTNYGTITADHQEGVGLRAGGSLDNLGVIDANEYGVFLYGPGTATNSGTISGSGAIITNYAGDVVVNSGTITGTRGGGIILQAGGTVIDSGTIAASYFAVLFRGTVSNLLVLENGYKLSGPVGGSASASSNVVELLGTSAANTVTANYNGLDLTRIGTIAFAPSATNYATLVITNDGTLPHTIANFIGVHETIDLTALNDSANDAVTSFNSANDQLTVTAGAASVTLQLDSEDYSGVVFVAQQDGTGTAITPFTTAPPSIDGTTAGQEADDAQTVQPFSAAAILDANGTLSQSVTITLSDSADGILSGTGLTETAPGVYSFTAADAAAATTLLDALVFTPTAHQVAPGDIVSTGFTIAVTNGIGESASDSTTSVAVTALANAPSISGTLGGQGVPDQTAITPFAGVAVTDVDVGAIDTATVSFDAADGTLSNLGSGSVSGGTYTITGTPGQVTAALDALTFTPATPAGGYIDGPAAFGLTVTGTGGTASNDAASVTAATQVLGLATLPASQIVVAVSPDGSGFGQAVAGKTNEAIVTNPVAGGSYTLPGGYQAEFLAGSVGATLTDASVGGAILVGNTGNDTLIAGGANDSIEAGNGNNVLVGGSGQVAIAAGNGANTISLASDADYTVSTGNGSDTIFAAGSGTVSGGSGSNVFVALGGANVIRSQGSDFISAAAGDTTVQASGNGVRVLGGAAGSTLVATITGSGATVSAADSAATVFARGNDAVLFGGGQTAAFVAAGQADTIAGGAGTTRVTVTGNDGVVLGGAGSLTAVIQGTGATIGGGAGAATVGVQTSALMFGNAGSLVFQGGSGVSTIVGGTGAATVSGRAVMFGNAGSTIDYTGASGGAEFLAGGGSETLDASFSSTGNEMWGSANAAARDVMRGGSGSDTLVAGAGAATLSGGAGANTFVFFHADAGGSSVITDFSTADEVVLSGYAASEAGTALQTATSAGGATALTLSDGTRITFLGVASASTLQGHLI